MRRLRRLYVTNCARPRPAAFKHATAQNAEGGRWPPSMCSQANGRLYAAARRLTDGAWRRMRHRTRPWSIRASGTAKVGTMTSG